MTCSLRIDGKSTLSDFGMHIASSNTGVPTKSVVRETVAHMNGFHDFSAINGEPTWEERKISYTFDFIAESVEDLYRQKLTAMNFFGNVQDTDIYDDALIGFHFHGSYDNSEWEEDESGLSATLRVTFVCQPFMIANTMTKQELDIGTQSVIIRGQSVEATAAASQAASIEIDGVIRSVAAGGTRIVPLKRGTNSVKVTGDIVTLTWREELL